MTKTQNAKGAECQISRIMPDQENVRYTKWQILRVTDPQNELIDVCMGDVDGEYHKNRKRGKSTYPWYVPM